jgi:hypothetical protein
MFLYVCPEYSTVYEYKVLNAFWNSAHALIYSSLTSVIKV